MDTPSHTRSWGLSGRWKPQNITIKCSGYHYQFDVSKQEVYELVGEVLRDVDALFGDSDYIHLGGDEVSNPCWDLVPAIKTFMAERNISNYGELQMYWRKQLRKNLAPTRKVLFWKNANGNVSVGDDEVLHYWGAQSATADCKHCVT